MSSTTSPLLGPGNEPPQSESYDPPGAPNMKKVKVEQSDTNRAKGISWTSVPSSAFLCKSTPRKKITLAPKFDYPSSAFKVMGASETNTSSCSCSTLNAECDVCGEDLRKPVQSATKVDQQDKHENQESQNSVEVEPEDAKELSLAHCDEKPENSATKGNDLKSVEDVSLSNNGEQEMEATESQEEEEMAIHVSKNEGGGSDAWQELPFFEVEEVDGRIFNHQLAPEMEASKAAAKGGNDGCIVERKHKKKHDEKSAKTGKEKERPKRLPPNAFVALRIPSPDIKAKVEEIQGVLLAKDGRLEPTFVSPAKNHITLLVLRINHATTEEIEKAKLVLLEATQKVSKDLDLLNDPLVLNFSGLGNFSKNVLFAKVVEGKSRERLVAMAGIVRSVFSAKELASDNHKEFTPHLTIAKMTMAAARKTNKNRRKMNKKKNKRKGGKEPDLRGIDRSAHAEHLDMEFGSQLAEGLELLSMVMPQTEDGYYHCFEKYSFDSSSSFLSDSEDNSGQQGE